MSLHTLKLKFVFVAQLLGNAIVSVPERRVWHLLQLKYGAMLNAYIQLVFFAGKCIYKHKSVIPLAS